MFLNCISALQKWKSNFHGAHSHFLYVHLQCLCLSLSLVEEWICFLFRRCILHSKTSLHPHRKRRKMFRIKNSENEIVIFKCTRAPFAHSPQPLTSSSRLCECGNIKTIFLHFKSSLHHNSFSLNSHKIARVSIYLTICARTLHIYISPEMQTMKVSLVSLRKFNIYFILVWVSEWVFGLGSG